MKNIFLITVAAILFCSLSFGQSSDKKESEKLEISSDIGNEFDKKQLERDVTAHKEENYKPFSSFNFPRTKYVGSAATGPIQLNDTNFSGFFFAAGNHDEFRKLFPKNSKDEYQVFFSIITYSSVESVSEQLVSSRNFPKYYIGQSSLKTKTSKIDYFAFIDSSGKSYAIVNGKIFDLTENGKTLILLPSEDGSLNFIQVKTPYLTLVTLHNYYANLLKNTEIKVLIGKAKSKTK